MLKCRPELPDFFRTSQHDVTSGGEMAMTRPCLYYITRLALVSDAH